MLESLEQSNVKRMSLESPESDKALFSPEDISEAEWEEIAEKAESVIFEQNTGAHVWHIPVDLRKLNQKIDVSNLFGLGEHRVEDYVGKLLEYLHKNNFNIPYVMAAEAYKKYFDVRVVSDDSLEILIQRELRKRYQDSNDPQTNLMFLRLVELGREIGLNIPVSSEHLNNLEKYLDRAKGFPDTAAGFPYLRTAALARRLNLPVQIDPSQIRRAQEYLETARLAKNWSKFTELASMLVDLQSVSLAEPKTGPIPEQRNF